MAKCLVVSWNVRGLNSAVKRSLVLAYLRRLRPQVCILQETHLVGSRILSLKKAWVGAHYHAPYSNYARGISILVHRSLPFQIVEVKLDPGGRYILLHALISEIPFVIVGLYLPPPADVAVLHELMQKVILYNVENVLFMGDFNLAPSRDIDRLHASGPTQHGLSRWASAFHTTDVWRHYHPSDRAFTCLSTTYRTMSRMDLAFASSTLLRRIESPEILSRGISDHAPVSVTIRLSHVVDERVWRLSKYWIMDPDIQEELPEALCDFWLNNNGSTGPLVQWDAFKAWLRGEYMTRIATKKRDSVQFLRHLEIQAKLKEEEYIQNPDQNHYVLWQDSLRELSLLRVELTQKSMLDSAQRVFEFGDKNGKLLAWLARGRNSMTHIGRVKAIDGRLLTTPMDINARFLELYQNLYASRARFRGEELLQYLERIPFPSLMDEKREELDRDISLEEVQEALGAMQSGKSPGTDGIPIEFYATHQDLLAPRLTSLLLRSAELGSIPDSLSEAIVVLVPKPGKDPEECASYRPISLINADAKLLAKILAIRIGKVIEDLV